MTTDSTSISVATAKNEQLQLGERNGHLQWPFFDDLHRELARDARRWASTQAMAGDDGDVDASCRALVRALGAGGWLRYCVPKAHGGAIDKIDSRSLCLLRETLAYHHGLADFAFAMQGLGSGAISLAGSASLQARYLPRVARGDAIAAFALSEPDAGSDVAAMQSCAKRVGEHYVLNGCKTWISNGGIADFYTVFARNPDSVGTPGISAFAVESDTSGLHIAERIEAMAPHPLARIEFKDCRIPVSQLIGAEGEGFKLAMATLDIFRVSVAAAALGFARRAFFESIAHVKARKMFGQTLADFQLTQMKLAEMATAIDASALLTYRAAWSRDVKGVRATKEAAMAKMSATESAQEVIDKAVQLFGGRGVARGAVVERLYREIRALRIYEGATEIQMMIIGRELLRDST